MEPILFWYPVVLIDSEDPEECLITRVQGRILPCQLTSELYEADVNARGCTYHLIFGKYADGEFLCIPNWNTGCELADLMDREANMEFLLGTDQLDYEDCTAISWALYSIGSVLKLLHH